MRQTTRGRTLLALALALLAAGCGDDDGTDPRALDYRPWETVSLMSELVDPVLEAENAMTGIGAAGEALIQFSTEPTGALRTGSAAGIRGAAEALRRTRSGWAQVTLPSDIMGRTLVWDPEAGEYVVDEARTDGPEDGVRVLFYALSPFTGRPAEPLVEVGYIDLTDEDVAGEERLGIIVVETAGDAPATLLDYVVSFSGYVEETDGDATFTGVGSLAGIVFDLLQDFTWSEAEGTDQVLLEYGFRTDEAEVRFRMDATANYETPAWRAVDLRVDLTDGAEEVAVDVRIDLAGELEGEIRLDGAVVVVVGGVDGSPSFTYPDGGRLQPEAIESLRELWTLISAVLATANGLMSPAGLLLLPG